MAEWKEWAAWVMAEVCFNRYQLSFAFSSGFCLKATPPDKAQTLEQIMETVERALVQVNFD